MAFRYYDDIIVAKLKKWIPDGSKLRVLKPDETKRLFEEKADDSKDKPIDLPIIALSRNTDFNIDTNIKTPMSYDGLKIGLANAKDGRLLDPATAKHAEYSIQMNVIPVTVEYKLDIYTKKYEEGDEYLRNFLFKLINNPKIIIEIPYNNLAIQHTANLRVLSTVSDTSDIAERLFTGQFTRWTISIELQDGFLFSIPYRKNWRMFIDDDSIFTEAELELLSQTEGGIEVSNKITESGEIEDIELIQTKK